MKRKVTSRERKQANNLKSYSIRTANIRQRKLYQPFYQLGVALEKKYSKVEGKGFRRDLSIEIERTFKPLMQQALFNVWALNINQFVDYFVDTFKRTINQDQIQPIKSAMLKRFSDRYMAKKVVDISETLEKILNKRVSKYLEEGLSIRDMARKIVEDTKGEIKLSRAKVIARNETSQAISETNLTTAKESGLKYKMWIHTAGGKTHRPNHMAMNGVTVKIDEKFSVPGHGSCPATDMEVPKDINSGVACQVINCYCQVSYTAKR